MIFDIHIHSSHSDGWNTPAEIVEYARKIGLNGISITDHDKLDGSREAMKFNSDEFTVIPGVEISCREGHLLVLGTNDIDEKYLGDVHNREKCHPVSKVLDAIHDTGALGIAAHPYDTYRKGFEDLAKKLDFDAIEVMNGHTLVNKKNPTAVAEEIGKPMVGGSDAHILREVGNVCVVTDDEPLEAIRSGRVRIKSRSRLKMLLDFPLSVLLVNLHELTRK